MRRSKILKCNRLFSSQVSKTPIIRILNGKFSRFSADNSENQGHSALFEGLSFTLPSFPKKPEYWAVLGPSSSGKTTFLQILRGEHQCFPHTARAYPFLSDGANVKSRVPSRAIQYVGFAGDEGGMGGAGTRGAYLSARYESRREETDFSVLDYLQGHTELNPAEKVSTNDAEAQRLDRVIDDLRLTDLVKMPVSNLSNGQTRRARIAKALLENPQVLLLDEPFMGLDPPTLVTLSPLLYRLAKAHTPRIVLTLRPQDPIPAWITHLIYLKSNCQVAFQGQKRTVLENLKTYAEGVTGGHLQEDLDISLHMIHEVGRTLESPQAVDTETINDAEATAQNHKTTSHNGAVYRVEDAISPTVGETLIEMKGARVAYGEKVVLGNWQQEIDGKKKDGLWWTVRRGQRWGIFGPNGSGKTTLLSLVCSDHPQTYSLPIKLFGRSRLPEPGQPGISIFDIQSRIGQSSPEIQSFMPRSMTLRQVLENAWAETFLGRPRLDEDARLRVDACLRWFEADLNRGTRVANHEWDSLQWADHLIYGQLPFSAQRVALFLRAIIKHPDIVILDEAFSGMDDALRDKCLIFLAYGESKTYSYGEREMDERRTIVDSMVEKQGKTRVGGLRNEQALLCISHVREEIPGCIREWICLPEANEGNAAQFGRLDGPIQEDYNRWNDIWGL